MTDVALVVYYLREIEVLYIKLIIIIIIKLC